MKFRRSPCSSILAVISCTCLYLNYRLLTASDTKQRLLTREKGEPLLPPSLGHQQDQLEYLTTSEPRQSLSHIPDGVTGDISPEYPSAINCSKLFIGNRNEIERAKQAQRPVVSLLTYEYYLNATQNCGEFLEERRYIMRPVCEEEEAFPLAFSILMFRDPDMAERLLRAIYRPWNHYCIHLDKKSDRQTVAVMKSVAACLPGVFLSDKRVSVKRETISLVTPELHCMRELWTKPDWKYYINLTGMEFPIRTNWELVQIMKAYRGANDILGGVHWEDRRRYRTVWIGQSRTEALKAPPPHNITVTKGAVHMVATRGYVDFVIHNQVSKDFLEWSQNIHTPDEMYFSSLNHNPQLGVPGAFVGSIKEMNSKKSYARFKRWHWGSVRQCPGEEVRHRVCLLGVRSLSAIAQAKELFANKFMPSYEPLAYDCLEQWHRNRTVLQLTGWKGDLNVTLYENLPFVLKHV